MLEGNGGNIAASVGDDGILLVDLEFAPLADKIAAALKGIGVTDKPVRFAIDTHYHYDQRSDGNPAWGARGVTVISNDNLRKRLESGSSIRQRAGRSDSRAATGDGGDRAAGDYLRRHDGRAFQRRGRGTDALPCRAHGRRSKRGLFSE